MHPPCTGTCTKQQRESSLIGFGGLGYVHMHMYLSTYMYVFGRVLFREGGHAAMTEFKSTPDALAKGRPHTRHHKTMLRLAFTYCVAIHSAALTCRTPLATGSGGSSTGRRRTASPSRFTLDFRASRDFSVKQA